MVLNLDIKQTAPTVTPYEETLAAMLRRFGREEDVIVASFLDTATDAFSAFAPESPPRREPWPWPPSTRQWRPERPRRRWAMWPCRSPSGAASSSWSTEAFVEAAHRAGLAVHVWTIEEESEMDELVELGVDGIITDRPTELDAVLAG